jgi:radical SAM superfamily enzyme YgiQ (UPF0313 family)
MPRASSRFLLHLVKPSHYDDDGYVIQWRRGWIPSNSLSALYGLALDARDRRILGDDVDIEVEALDETNTVVRLGRLIRRFRQNGGAGLVCLVGVQTNQFPRALDIARRLRAAGIQVAVGGFHASGCMAMLPELPADVQEMLALGATVVAGEAEGRFDDILRAAAGRALAPIYDFMKELPGLGAQPVPFLPAGHTRRYLGAMASFDAGRGCPFTCGFCTIINVQGRKSRYRDAGDVEQVVRMNAAQGIHRFFITDDNFARNRNWQAIFDRLIALRENEGIAANFTIQVDTQAHRLPGFVAKAARAGCRRVFIGLENINPDSLLGASKGQNRITEYRRMLQAWRAEKVVTYAGYILGFPADTPESIARDIGIIQRELPIDMLEFFILTPLPGSQDHQQLHRRGVPMDADMNRYDVEHVTVAHPRMSREAWQATYERAWGLYYSWDHIETLFRRGVAGGLKMNRLLTMVFIFAATQRYYRVHPLQTGLLRRKRRRDRRADLPRESPFVFYPRRVGEMLACLGGLWFLWKLWRLRLRVEREAATAVYQDAALAPVADDRDEMLELYQATEAAREAVARTRARAPLLTTRGSGAPGAP